MVGEPAHPSHDHMKGSQGLTGVHQKLRFLPKLRAAIRGRPGMRIIFWVSFVLGGITTRLKGLHVRSYIPQGHPSRTMHKMH
jgi:hypothetical protein